MSGIWPGATQCVAMLTFDVDGVSSWLRRNPDFAQLPSLLSMAEYGPSVAAPRILDLLDDYGISNRLGSRAKEMWGSTDPAQSRKLGAKRKRAGGDCDSLPKALTG